MGGVGGGAHESGEPQREHKQVVGMATHKGLMPQNLESIFPVKLRRSASGEDGSVRTMRRSTRRGTRNMRGKINVRRGMRNLRSEEREERGT